MWTIIVTVVVGTIIGALARLIMPGRQNISILATIFLGILGALAGSGITSAMGGGDSFNFIALIVGVACAIVFIAVYLMLTGRRTRS